MKGILVFILLIFLSQIAIGQDTTSILGLRIKSSPLSWINPQRPYLNLNVELLFWEKIGLEVGYGKRYLDLEIWDVENKDSVAVDFRGNKWTLGLNFRNVFLKDNKNYSDYFGISYRRIDDLSNLQSPYYPLNVDEYDEEDLRDEYFGIQKKLNIWDLQFGIIDRAEKFSVEMGLGLGWKYKNQFYVENDLKNNENYNRRGAPFSPFPQEVEGYRPTARIIFKLAYKLF